MTKAHGKKSSHSFGPRDPETQRHLHIRPPVFSLRVGAALVWTYPSRVAEKHIESSSTEKKRLKASYNKLPQSCRVPLKILQRRHRRSLSSDKEASQIFLALMMKCSSLLGIASSASSAFFNSIYSLLTFCLSLFPPTSNHSPPLPSTPTLTGTTQAKTQTTFSRSQTPS